MIPINVMRFLFMLVSFHSNFLFHFFLIPAIPQPSVSQRISIYQTRGCFPILDTFLPNCVYFALLLPFLIAALEISSCFRGKRETCNSASLVRIPFILFYTFVSLTERGNSHPLSLTAPTLPIYYIIQTMGR